MTRDFLLVLLVSMISSAVFSQDDDLIPYLSEGKYGYSDKQGVVRIAPQYVSASFFQYGVARVTVLNKEMGRPNVVFINRKGQNAFKDTFQNAMPFFHILVEEKPGVFYKKLVTQIVKNNKPGLLSIKGERVTAKAYKFSEFQETITEKYVEFPYRLIYSEDYEKKGLAVDSGTVLAPVYDHISVIDLHRGIFIVMKDEKRGLINQSLRKEINWYEVLGLLGSSDSVRQHYHFMFKVEEKYAIMDESGELLLRPEFDWMVPLDAHDELKMLYGKYVDGKLVMGLFDVALGKQLLKQEYSSIEKTHLPYIYKVKKRVSNMEIEFYVNINGIQYKSES